MKAHAIVMMAVLGASPAWAVNPLDYLSTTDLTQGGRFTKLICHSMQETVCDKDFRCTALEDSPTPPDDKGQPQPLVRFSLDLQKRDICMNDCKLPQHLPGMTAEKRIDGLDMRWYAKVGDTKLTFVAMYPNTPKATQLHYNRSYPVALNANGRQNIEFGRCELVSANGKVPGK